MSLSASHKVYKL